MWTWNELGSGAEIRFWNFLRYNKQIVEVFVIECHFKDASRVPIEIWLLKDYRATTLETIILDLKMDVESRN